MSRFRLVNKIHQPLSIVSTVLKKEGAIEKDCPSEKGFIGYWNLTGENFVIEIAAEEALAPFEFENLPDLLDLPKDDNATNVCFQIAECSAVEGAAEVARVATSLSRPTGDTHWVDFVEGLIFDLSTDEGIESVVNVFAQRQSDLAVIYDLAEFPPKACLYGDESDAYFKALDSGPRGITERDEKIMHRSRHHECGLNYSDHLRLIRDLEGYSRDPTVVGEMTDGDEWRVMRSALSDLDTLRLRSPDGRVYTWPDDNSIFEYFEVVQRTSEEEP